MRKKLLLSLIILVILGFSFEVLALETTWPDSPLSPGFTLTDNSTLTDMVRYFYEWGIFIGGLAVFISLLIGGFLYLTSMGNPARMTEAKDRIFSAVIGLILLLAIYLILNTINPELTVLTLNPIGGKACTKKEDCPTGFECKEGICLPPLTKVVYCDVDGECKGLGPKGEDYVCEGGNTATPEKEGVCIPPGEKITRCDTNDDCSSLGEGYECTGGDTKTECKNNDPTVCEGVCAKTQK